MATSTPVKVSDISCFVCCVTRARPINLNGRKSKQEGFCEKFKFVLNIDSVFEGIVNSDSPLVCRNCYSKIEHAYEFSVQLRNNAKKFVSERGSAVRIKRGIASPATPKSAKESFLPVSRSRKQLKLLSSPVTSCPVPTTEEPTTQSSIFPVPEEHTYSKSLPDMNISHENPIACHLQEILSNITSCEDEDFGAFKELRLQLSTLTSRTASFCSVLYKYRDVNKLEANGDHFMDEIIEEMTNRVPLLLKIMLCVATPTNGNVNPSIIPALASAYSILMKHRYNNLSAYHRLTTIIAIRGGLDERAQTRLNQLGLMLSWSARVTLQESIQTMTDKLIAGNLKQNPLVKITGDNLDIYVKTSNLGKDRRHKDLHLFASNLIFSRVATTDMNNNSPKIDISNLDTDKVLMCEHSSEKAKLLHCYKVLLARVLCKMPAFEQYGKLFPKHIPHEFSEKMSRKSTVHPLPILFKNETKHEDCMSIMDRYEEQLISLHMQAFGNVDLLRKFGVPVGGDQLTRVRLCEAKNLRSLSATPEKRYEDLHPIVCEMWHTKQDLLEKCYKKLFEAELSPGTLNHFKTILHRTDVNGKVKGRFQAHFNFLMTVGEGMIMEQFLEFFKMDGKESQPSHNLLADLHQKEPCEQTDVLMNVIHEFVAHYGYGTVDCPKEMPKPNSGSQRIVGFTRSESNQLIIRYEVPTQSDPDDLYNYSMQLCHWYLHLNELHDTAKEGDLNRTVINCQYSLPFFYSHSKLSKYLVENINYILQCKYLLSPLQKMRVLEGSYVNTKGGKGQNVESDLTQEHSVGNQKALIKSLVANKSEKAIKRVTGAADTIAEICSNFDNSVNIKPKSGHHSKPLNESDQDLISKTLRKIRPFRFTPGRKCSGFTNISSIPVSVDQMTSMKQRFNQIITRLTRGFNVAVEEDDEDDNDNIED